jgi:hypothetical protein
MYEAIEVARDEPSYFCRSDVIGGQVRNEGGEQLGQSHGRVGRGVGSSYQPGYEAPIQHRLNECTQGYDEQGDRSTGVTGVDCVRALLREATRLTGLWPQFSSRFHRLRLHPFAASP